MLQQLEAERRRDLIWSVRYAQVKKWHLRLDCITLYDAELVRVAKLLDALRDFGNHTRIDLHRNDLLAALQQLHSRVTRSWTDLKNYVCRLDAAFFDNLLNYLGILQYMLTKRLVECEVVGVPGTARRHFPLLCR